MSSIFDADTEQPEHKTKPLPTSLQKRIDKLTEDYHAQQNRKWSYYQNMRREDPRRYFDPKTRKQLEQDALALGNDFIDTE